MTGVCDLCHKVRPLFALTRKVDSVGHRIPLKACRECCGPGEDDKATPSPYMRREP